MAFRVVYLIGGGQRVLSRRKDLISNEHPRGRPCAAPAGAIGVSILNEILPYDAERRGIKPNLLVRHSEREGGLNLPNYFCNLNQPFTSAVLNISTSTWFLNKSSNVCRSRIR